jgi:N-acetylglutamate synthase-like GNAT family acetyltransferase
MLAMPPVQQIRPCEESDFDAILAIVNDAAVAYRGKIPEDCWSEPYMSAHELAAEIRAGVNFSGFEEDGQLLGVMGLQDVQDVVLIRHAYTRTAHQGRGIGSRLLDNLVARTDAPVLVGTWADATWAIRFYQRHGFRLVPPDEKASLLGRYWSIPPRQVETSVVLADKRWFEGATS